MKLTTTTHVSVDGVMQGLGGQDEDRRGGFERGGWAIPLFDNDGATLVNEIYQRADAFLFGRWTYEVFAGYWGAMKLTYPVVMGQGTRLFPASGPDVALDLVESRSTPNGITIQVYRPAGRPEYAT